MKKIMIVGGGSAGWMTAATLIKFFPNKEITVIESPDVPTVGVGESTIFQIREWLRSLEIDTEDFIKHTDASYKLSIKFTDFYKKGESFHYPFGQPDFTNNAKGFNDWWYKKFLIPDTPNSDFADCMFPQMGYVNNNTYDKKIPSAYHFDATKFGLWLKDRFCLPRGVKYIQEDIKDIQTDENGIVSLNNYKADLYIDCTGFKSMLLSGALKEEFESLEDLLPNNSAWATRMPYKNKEKELVPYTNCTAIQNGWVWNIPLWSRIGTGYVYSDKFISDDDALKQFKDYLGKDDLEFRNIKMRVGIHKRLWVKNVVAIGLSAGFIEPLESNGLFSVHEFVHILVRNLQREENVSEFDRANFNYNCKMIFYNFAEFVASHYALSHRADTDYWRQNLKKDWSKEISNQLPTLKKGFLDLVNRRSFAYEYDNSGYACISAGMHFGPTDIPSILKYNEEGIEKFKEDWFKVTNILNEKKELWDKQAKKADKLYKVVSQHYENSNT